MNSNPLCNLRTSRSEAETKISERIKLGKELLTALEKLKEAVFRTSGYERDPETKHTEKRDLLWSDYLRWDDFNKELLNRIFDSSGIAAEYGAPREPEATYGVFLAEVEEFQNNLKDDLQRLRSIKERLPLFEEIRVNARSQNSSSESQGIVFIGHGRSREWLALQSFLKDRLHLQCVEFNTESAAGVGTQERLSELLDQAGFAFLVMTAEDEQSDGSKRARENVVHEAGLFQGRLTFRKAIVVVEEGTAEFSNIHGLGQIRFPNGQIQSCFEDVRRVLERERIVKPH